ncbi:hypothetical protein, partial [Klebsiella pneumoniae]|uniref:hypothetical protein n=1 Tax=Klebsiella pneumoniae TaxID=573 RepID=UPI003B98036C
MAGEFVESASAASEGFADFSGAFASLVSAWSDRALGVVSLDSEGIGATIRTDPFGDRTVFPVSCDNSANLSSKDDGRLDIVRSR